MSRGAIRAGALGLALLGACLLVPGEAATAWPRGFLEGTRDLDALPGGTMSPEYIQAIRRFGRLEDHLARARKEKKPLVFYFLYTPG